MHLRLYLTILALSLGLYPAHAMHIMEGYMPLEWCVFWFSVSLPFVVISYRYIARQVQHEAKERLHLALNAAFVFVLSALKLPSVAGSSSHLTGTTLGTLTSGVRAMPLIGFVVLIFQALLLAHGGISTLGANVFSLAIAGPLVAWASYQLFTKLRTGLTISVALATILGSMSTYLVTSLQLALVFPDAMSGVWGAFIKFFTIFGIAQAPLTIIEAGLTVGAMRIVSRIIPNHSTQDRSMPMSSKISLGLFALLGLTLPLMAGYFDFGLGTDDQAGDLVSTIAPNYTPMDWIKLFEPSEALEPWLFVVQVAIGLGLIAWVYRTYWRAKH